MKQKHPNEVVLIETRFQVLEGEASELSEAHVQALKAQRKRQLEDEVILLEETSGDSTER